MRILEKPCRSRHWWANVTGLPLLPVPLGSMAIMPLLLVLAAIAWIYFGEPSVTLAHWFWSDSAAPWETVDAFYYPSRHDLSIFEIAERLESVVACQDWVHGRASMNGDPDLIRGDYECGVGAPRHEMGLRIYRQTVR
jgi:hypothetical protein